VSEGEAGAVRVLAVADGDQGGGGGALRELIRTDYLARPVPREITP
jgi:hypothetical protein